MLTGRMQERLWRNLASQGGRPQDWEFRVPSGKHEASGTAAYSERVRGRRPLPCLPSWTLQADIVNRLLAPFPPTPVNRWGHPGPHCRGSEMCSGWAAGRPRGLPPKMAAALNPATTAPALRGSRGEKSRHSTKRATTNHVQQ
ncbi:Hypothetical predicted protein [Pelobates cultripes]|uniref:Uncharacterized protein n=1 Tax=Pelobates cultripes TaxID=61616 RepID=A0AAD1RHD1_PELCU|nr:Hypothetical predicted protein [Pelobates cultripes]